MELFSKARARCFIFIIGLMVFFLANGVLAQEEESAEEGSEDSGSEIIDRLEDTPLGPAIKWLFDEDRKYFFIPIVSSGPDTGLILGVTWYQTDIFGKDKRDMILAAITTESGQNNLFFSWTEPGIPLEDGRISASVFLSDNPDGGIRYFGNGNDNDYEDVVCNYRASSKGFSLGYIYEFTDHYILWTGYSFSDKEFDNPRNDFEMGDKFSSRPISWVHPKVFLSEPFQEGYKSASISTSLSYDSRTRTRLLRLGPGYRWSMGGSWADKDFGGDYDWADYSASFSHYVPLTKSNKHIIAYRGRFQHSWGQEPFDQFPALSSDTNRGYYSGRFRGENKLEGNLEYRWYPNRFLGIAVFADSGKVFETGEDWDDALFTDYHPAFGGGIRLMIPPEIIFRIDFGVSEEQTNTYFTLGESF